MGGPDESMSRHSDPFQAQSCVGWLAGGPVAAPRPALTRSTRWSASS